MLSQISRLLRQRPALTVLLALHGLFLYEYYGALWSRQHYQFYPFALAAFLGLFATRRAEEPDRWSWFSKLLLGAGVLAFLAVSVLRFGFDRNMPLVGAVSFVLLLTAWCSAHRDAGYGRRLTYLSVLPWMTIRLPLNYDEEVIHWLQRVTTSVASKSLHRMEMLHYREGNMLQFPGKSFMVEEACSGVQSLFTIMFLAALVLCLKRRSVVHGFLMLLAGIAFAGMMNVARVVFIAFAWEAWQLDVSTGWQHEAVGYGSLLIAAMLLLSTDALLGFFTDVVPDVRRPGLSGLYFNPLIRLWNSLVAVIPSTTVAGVESRPAATKEKDLASSDVAERRSWPTVLETLRPSYLFQFNLGFAESWLFSRNYRQIVGAMPSILTATGGILLVWWLRHAAIDPVLATYEEAYNAAVADKDLVRQENFLRALDSLRPTEPQYRFRLAQFMLKQGRTNDGLAEIIKLAPENALGHIEARMWLATQAASKQPVMPMTLDQIEAQLKAVLSQSANHLDAHLMLAALYKQRGEFRLAEQHLADAARVDPEKNLELGLLKRDLKRSAEDVQNYAGRAIAALTEKMQVNRDNPAVRVRLAEAMLLAGQESEARELLAVGLTQKDDPSVRTALSNLDLLMCDRRLRESPLNRDACVPVVIEALRRDPSNAAGLMMLTSLKSIGASVDATQLAEPMKYWTEQLSANPENQQARVMLGQLKAVGGQLAEAGEILQPASQQDQNLLIPYARILVQTQQADMAAQVLEPVMAEARSTLASSPQDIAAAMKLGECLMVLQKADEAHELLAQFAQDPTKSRIPSDEKLAIIFCQACLLRYDAMSGYKQGEAVDLAVSLAGVDVPKDLNTDQAIELLSDAVRCQPTSAMAIDRLARLSLSEHPASVRAEELIRQIRLDGDFGATVLNHIGTHALILKRYEKARTYLELANTQSRGRDPMVLNNLATCLARAKGADAESLKRALELANQTLAILPDHPDALSTRGEIYVAMARWSDAIADLTQSLKSRRNNPEVHRLLEKSYRATNDAAMADEHAKRALELESAQAKN